MNEAVVRYVAGGLLCAVISLAYAAIRKRGLRAIVAYTAFCFGCMAGVVAAVAAIVYLLCSLK